MRVLIKYGRENSACYISHLDMQRAFGRAFRRGNIKVLYSEGYNPHIKMSFAAPLSLGYKTLGDYLEVFVDDDEEVSTIMAKLNNVLPKDIRVQNVGILPLDAKKLMAINHSAAYEIIFMWQNSVECDIINSALNKIEDEISNKGSYITQNSKGKEVDIAPLIITVKHKEGVITTTLANGEKSLNPRVIAGEILKIGNLNLEYTVVRLNCFCSYKGKITAFESIAK